MCVVLNLNVIFVWFSSIGMAKAALESLNGFNLFGSQVIFHATWFEKNHVFTLGSIDDF